MLRIKEKILTKDQKLEWHWGAQHYTGRQKAMDQCLQSSDKMISNLNVYTPSNNQVGGEDYASSQKFDCPCTFSLEVTRESAPPKQRNTPRMRKMQQKGNKSSHTGQVQKKFPC